MLRHLTGRLFTRWLPATLLLVLVGCSATIVPPTEVQQPVTVYVLDHGRHSSLVLPTDKGATRYSYGDWDYYVLRQTGAWNALRALLHPSPAALGRQELPLTPSEENLPGQLRVGVTQILPIDVEHAVLQALHSELEESYHSAIATRHYNEAFDVHFVHYPTPYTLRNNSNRKVGDWLEALGCDIRGTPMLSNWHLDEATPRGANARE